MKYLLCAFLFTTSLTLGGEPAAELARLQGLNENLFAKNAGLVHKIQLLTEESAAAQFQARSLTTQLEAAQLALQLERGGHPAQIAELQQKISELERDKEEMAHQLAERTIELDRERSTVSEHRLAELTEQQEMVGLLRTQLAEYAGAGERRARPRAQASGAAADAAELRVARAELSGARKQIAQLMTTNAQLMARITELERGAAVAAGAPR